MKKAPSVLSPKRMATEAFTDASAAGDRIEQIYERNTAFLRDRFEAYVQGEPLKTRVRATYPFVRITTTTHARVDSRLSYGFVSGPVQGCGRRPQRRCYRRQQPASATGQGTKSREVERRGCGWRYGDLGLRDVMMVVAPHHGAGRRRMPRMPIQAAEQPERGPRMAI
jgi:hypothetical protein